MTEVAPVLEFVPARLPEAVAMKPGQYEVVRGPDTSDDDSPDPGDSDESSSSDGPAGTRSSSPQSSSQSSRARGQRGNASDTSASDTSATSGTSDSSDSETFTNTQAKRVPAGTVSFYDFNENPRDHGAGRDARVWKTWHPTARAAVGLENRGVTCYMNAAIQTLFHLPAVGRYLLDITRGEVPNISRNSVSADLASLYKKVTEARKLRVYPAKVIRRLADINCMMSEWEQEDSHEYYMSLISRLQEDSVPKGQKLSSSILHSIFGGTLEQQVKCRFCRHVSTTKQCFYDLPVSLSPGQRRAKNYTLEQSIEDFFSPEALRAKGQDGYQCEKCKQVTKAWKHISIEEAPEYLTVHIKRFKFEGTSSQKVKDPVSYPITLDITQFSRDHESLRYKLVAVIVHEGRTVSSGHYIALCRQPNGDWFEYDDDSLRKISENSVKKHTSAYILVYSRLMPKAPPTEGPKRRKDPRSNPPVAQRTERVPKRHAVDAIDAIFKKQKN